MVYCSYCGNAVPPNYRTCHVCSHKLIKRPIVITLLSLYFIISGIGSLVSNLLLSKYFSNDITSIAIQASLIAIGIGLLSGKKLGRLVAIGLIVLSIGIHGYYLIENLDYAQIITIIIGVVLLYYLWRPHVVLYYNSKEIMRE